MTRDEARGRLDLPARFTKAELRLAYRRAAFHAHPDRGGNVEDMKAVNGAYDLLRGRGSPERAPEAEPRKRRRGPPPRTGGTRPETYDGQLWICTRCRSVWRGETLATQCACGGEVRRYFAGWVGGNW